MRQFWCELLETSKSQIGFWISQEWWFLHRPWFRKPF